MVICRPTRARRHGGMFVPSDPAVASALAAPKRPPGQRSIWLAELLERYGSYLIGALLPLYLNEQLGLPFTLSLRLTGYYLALGYAGGVLGGLVSDRFLGYRAATRLGGAVLAVGAALLASGRPGTLYPALLLLVLGSSCFKPALTAWLGSLYAADDAGGAGRSRCPNDAHTAPRRARDEPHLQRWKAQPPHAPAPRRVDPRLRRRPRRRSCRPPARP